MTGATSSSPIFCIRISFYDDYDNQLVGGCNDLLERSHYAIFD
jgi:hypothetical protein